MAPSHICSKMLMCPILCRSCADKCSCGEFMVAPALSYPEDIGPKLGLTFFLPPLLCSSQSFRGGNEIAFDVANCGQPSLDPYSEIPRRLLKQQCEPSTGTRPWETDSSVWVQVCHPLITWPLGIHVSWNSQRKRLAITVVLPHRASAECSVCVRGYYSPTSRGTCISAHPEVPLLYQSFSSF